MRFLRIAAALLIAFSAYSVEQDAFARSGGGFSGGGSRSSGGGRGYSAPSRSAPSAPSRGYSAPSRTYTAPSTPTIRTPTVTPRVQQESAPSRRPAPSYDSGAQRARQEAESQRAFREAQQEKSPKPVIRDAPTSTRPSAQERQPSRVEQPRTSPSNSGRYTSRPQRPIIVNRHYEDRTTSGEISPLFWIWLMERNNNRYRDEWIYHNRDRLSSDQMAEIRNRDAEIDTRIQEYESRGVQKNPNFKVPAEVEEESASLWWLWIGLLLLVGAGTYFYIFHYRRSSIARKVSDIGSALTHREEGKSEVKPTLPKDFFNPLTFAVGGYVRVETADLISCEFEVAQMSEFTRQFGKTTLKFTDYSLHDPNTGEGDGTWVTVRVVPKQEKGEFDCLLLRPSCQGGYTKKLETMLDRDHIYDEKFEAELVDDENKSTVPKNAGVKYRALGANDANIREMKKDGLNRLSLKYWDFINDDEPQPRFYMVEMDTSDKEGWIQSNHGLIVSQHDVKPIAGHTATTA